MPAPLEEVPINGRLTHLFVRLEKLESKKSSDRMWDIATRLMVPLALAAAGWVVGHEVRISNIESNRFTDKDAATLERRILSSVPPVWLREDLNEIKILVRDMDSRLRQLEAKVK